MYVVIMGGGRVGLNLAKALVMGGHDITLIESDDVLCGDLASELDALVICGNGSDKKILDEANIGDADVFVAATGNDESNILACIMANDYDLKKIIARVTDPNHEKVFLKIGVDAVVSPELTAASYLEKVIIRPKVADLVVLGKGDAEIIDITVANKQVVGKKIGEINPTEDYMICAMHENEDIVIPKPDMVLKRGDRVSVLAKTKAVRKVVNKFMV
ncbi:MAG: TrkA family potassium uptake protein [Methanobacteriaceae archaeon]|jgi:trk system potassium uptake protein TrkA|nr:TrkA family potassium uptake protein [Methanobacteriaceae archaeon]